MASCFTLGIEEEFQMVDKNTGQLASRVHTILDKGTALLGENIKAEMLQAAVEISTNVCEDISVARLELQRLRTALMEMVSAEGLALISAGTHPNANWQDQKRTQNQRYEELEQEFQDIARSILIFGQHVHVGIEHELAIPLMNQLRTWLPHMLAISSNSPFWAGRYTGIKSYRTTLWKTFPRSGLPNVFSSNNEFETYVQNLVQTQCLDNGKKIWWDIRPHPFFPTIEFRVCDMPATIEDTLAIASLCQALVAKLTWLYKHNLTTPSLPSHYIDENKWRASRYGLDAEVIDFVQGRCLSMRDAINELLDFVDDVVNDLNCRSEIDYIRDLLEDPRGTGADRQLAVYEQTGSIDAVTQYLIQQVMQDTVINHS